MTVRKIIGADIYRDGGSYGFWFDSDDGRWYEFFLKVGWGKDGSQVYQEPKLYLEGVNSRNIVQSLSWQAAIEFVAPLNFDSPRFDELVEIVNNKGRKAKSTSL